MSGLLDKAKDAVGKVSGGSSSSGSTNTSSGTSSTSKYTSQGVDAVTDKLGMGDKYDKQISEQADKQIQNQMKGSSGGSK